MESLKATLLTMQLIIAGIIGLIAVFEYDICLAIFGGSFYVGTSVFLAESLSGGGYENRK